LLKEWEYLAPARGENAGSTSNLLVCAAGVERKEHAGLSDVLLITHDEERSDKAVLGPIKQPRRQTVVLGKEKPTHQVCLI
jgi:hypothetical protein